MAIAKPTVEHRSCWLRSFHVGVGGHGHLFVDTSLEQSTDSGKRRQRRTGMKKLTGVVVVMLITTLLTSSADAKRAAPNGDRFELDPATRAVKALKGT